MQSSINTRVNKNPKAEATEIATHSNYLAFKIMTANSFGKATETFTIMGAEVDSLSTVVSTEGLWSLGRTGKPFSNCCFLTLQTLTGTMSTKEGWTEKGFPLKCNPFGTASWQEALAG